MRYLFLLVLLFQSTTLFEVGKPVKGSEAYASKIGNIIYYFSSVENQKLFEENPIKYLPQYDGYCALAISYGKKSRLIRKLIK